MEFQERSRSPMEFGNASREGKEGIKPDSTAYVSIATQGAINGMLLPGGMAILTPIVIGFIMGAEGLAGVLVGAIATGDGEMPAWTQDSKPRRHHPYRASL